MFNNYKRHDTIDYTYCCCPKNEADNFTSKFNDLCCKVTDKLLNIFQKNKRAQLTMLLKTTDYPQLSVEAYPKL